MKIPKFRISYYANGKYYVEIRTRRKSFFRSEKWEHVIFFCGSDTPFGYKNYESAMKDFLREIEKSINEND